MVDGQFRTEIQYGGESTYGTEVATTQEIGKVSKFTPTHNNNLMHIQGLGEGRDVTHSLYGVYDCGFDIEWEVSDFAFLKHWIGPQTGSGNTSSPYILTENDYVGLNTSTIQCFSMEVNHQDLATDDTDTYTGCVGNNFSLSGQIGSTLKCKASGVARSVTSSTTGTAYTAITTNPWIMAQGTWSWGTGPSAVAGIQSFTVDYSNSLIISRDIDSRFIAMPIAGIRSYKFSIVVKMTSTIATTFRDVFYGQANSPVTGVASASVIPDYELKILFSEGSSAGNRNAYLWLDACSIDSISKDISVGGDVVALTISGTAQTGRSNVPISWWTVA